MTGILQLFQAIGLGLVLLLPLANPLTTVAMPSTAGPGTIAMIISSASSVKANSLGLNPGCWPWHRAPSS